MHRRRLPRNPPCLPAERPIELPAAEPAEPPTKSPARTTVPEANLQIADEMETCAANLRKISAAIQKYKKDKGKMPDWLSDLVPNYLEKEVLLCPVKQPEEKPLWPDPKLPCNYNYEFSPTRLSSGWGAVGGLTCREWKTLQLKLFGEVVPAVRCSHGSRRLNASVGGQVYWSGGSWEPLFRPTHRRGDALPPGSSPPQPRQPGVVSDTF